MTKNKTVTKTMTYTMTKSIFHSLLLLVLLFLMLLGLPKREVKSQRFSKKWFSFYIKKHPMERIWFDFKVSQLYLCKVGGGYPAPVPLSHIPTDLPERGLYILHWFVGVVSGIETVKTAALLRAAILQITDYNRCCFLLYFHGNRFIAAPYCSISVINKLLDC